MTIIKTGRGDMPYDKSKLFAAIEAAAQDLNLPDLEEFKEKVHERVSSKEEYSTDQINDLLVLSALERVNIETPDWTFFAARVFANMLYKKAAQNRGYSHKEHKYHDFLGLIKTLVDKNIYHPVLLGKYSEEEIKELEREIVPERDKLFTYIGLRTLADRYLAKDRDGNVYELPQERFMVIAMYLMQDEKKEQRLNLVKEAYWALSNLYMTVATPTLNNAGKSFGQLSSCFIDTVEDSLDGIYLSNWDVARLSKGGGGIAVYLGHIRAAGSDIKGFKGVASGVIPWMKQLNNTAVSVDQLGVRTGSVAVYLDVWHKDIFAFLDARLNNGDERMRTHDLFTGVCIPDLFMEQVEKRGKWYLFDPHEILVKKGWRLEDYYDEEEGDGTFRKKYWELVNDPNISKEEVDAIDIMKRIMISQLETGTPYMFYRDTVNRMNPNKHAGIIRCSNLCTEILQNQSATTIKQEYTNDGEIVIKRTPGDFVVCNLSSINLGRAIPADVLERLIPIQMRMLDNVIDLNNIGVKQAEITNKRYRSVGMGTFGWHHLLALKGIQWESEEAVKFCDELYEKIAYLAIKSSVELAKEKGAYSLFKGSEWETGEYFERRGYFESDRFDWKALHEEIKKYGVRNAYMMAVAPNGTTAIIGGSTASVDPIFRKEYSEEKKDYKIPVTVPDLNPKTFWFYKSAYNIDQHWSIEQNAVRAKHIDQGISFNFYVPNTIKASQMLSLHLHAWKSGIKTTYYVRSTSQEVIDECESCAS